MSGCGALARLSVVVPIGPGDDITDALRVQLNALPSGAEVHVVYADDDAPEHANTGTPRASDRARARAAATDATTADIARAAPVATKCTAAVDIADADGPAWFTHSSRPGRALQQNTGARAARGDWIWFLHADSLLTQATLPALAGLLRTGVPVLAYFDLRFLADGPAAMPLNSLGARLRSRWLGLPFGDQGLALPRSEFQRIGGFDEMLRCGEDHALVWRARRAGLRLQPLRAPIYTSARRYADRGWFRATAWHLAETWRQARAFSRQGSDA